MDEDRMEGRTTFVLTILDEVGMPIEVVEGISNIKKELKKYDGGRDSNKNKVSDRG